jgi:hypothetical protein
MKKPSQMTEAKALAEGRAAAKRATLKKLKPYEWEIPCPHAIVAQYSLTVKPSAARLPEREDR